MPTYQYACTECHERLEAVQSFSDAALTECPACGGRLRKVFSAVGVVFKGSGFYKTDSRSGAKGSGEKADKGEAGKGGPDKPAGDKGSGGNGSGDKGSGDKGSGDKAAAAKAPAAASSSSSAPAAKSA